MTSVNIERKPFLKNMHYFRAFAIVNIVILHLWYDPLYKVGTPLSTIGTLREVLFHDATIYFLFISGFLFHYLSDRFETKKFFVSKLTNVVVPFCVMTFIILIRRQHLETGNWVGVPAFLGEYALALVKGNAYFHYWYIPFIVSVFLVCPLLLKIPKRAFSVIALASAFLPLLGTRNGTMLTFGTYLYFVPVFLIGMFFSMEYERVVRVIKRFWALVVSVAALATVFLYLCYRFPGLDLYPAQNESLFYVQKMAVSMIVMVLFMKLETRNVKVLDDFATYSFGIYFTHTLIISDSIRFFCCRAVANFSPVLYVPFSILFTAFCCFAVLYCCKLVKLVFRRFSRYLIGV